MSIPYFVYYLGLKTGHTKCIEYEVGHDDISIRGKLVLYMNSEINLILV